MKRKSLIFLASIVLCLSACTKNGQDGKIAFRLEGGDVLEVETKGSVTDYASLPSSGDFNLLVKNSFGTQVYSGKLSGWDPSTALAPGNYSASVSYGDASEEGPSKPCFEGSKDLAVRSGETSSVTIPVTLGNCVVRIVCTDQFRNYYPERTMRITTPESPSGFVYDGQAVFVAYQWSISGTLKSQAGIEYALPERSWRGTPATCYTVKYDVSNIGGVSISISFSDSVETVTLEEIELNQ